MVDFDKLNESINIINEVLNDFEKETKNIKTNVDCKKSDAFGIMYDDVRKYIHLIEKANNNNIHSFGFVFVYNDGHQIRIARDWNCGSYCYCIKVRIDCCEEWFPIWISNINNPYNEDIFECLNRSPKSVQWLVDVVAVNWDEYKDRIEKRIVEYINELIVERTKKAHKEHKYISAEAERLGV